MVIPAGPIERRYRLSAGSPWYNVRGIIMTLKTPEEIASAVEAEHRRTIELRDRFDEDYSLYRLDPFTGLDREDGLDPEDGYMHYTSSEPQTFADKIITWVATSKLILQIKHPHSQRPEREADNQKERFAFGILRAADERLTRLFMPGLMEQMAFFSAVRGFVFGRAMLVKRDDGTTYADIMPWDPLHTYWSMNGEGLEWACYKMRKTRGEIRSQYGVDVADSMALSGDNEGVEVFDYYDSEANMVVTSDRVLKKRTAHGSPRVPIFYGAVGQSPLLLSEESDDTIRDWGESVFKSGRNTYKHYQQMMSIMLELANRSRKPPIDVHSPDGTKTLEEDPYVAGSEISTAEGERVQALDLLRSAPDLGPFLALVSGEMQRGALPHTVWGELPFQLSGYAIQTLRQGIETILTPRLKAVEDGLQQVCRLISDQYAEGTFNDMELSGYDGNRTYFRETIDPSAINAGGDIEVRLVSVLPQDDVQKMSMAQIAREGPVPLLPDRHVREEILGIQDVDSLDSQIKEQIGERMLPEASLWDIMRAMEETGRMELAGFYYAQLVEILIQKMMQRQQLGNAAAQVAAGPGMMGGTAGGGGGVPPSVMPSQMVGGGPAPSLLSNPGPQVPPGTPRPGAMSDQIRLNQIGLVGPGG